MNPTAHSKGADPRLGPPALLRSAILVALALGALFFWLDRGSLERGNWVAHEGDLSEAATLYRRHADDPENVVAAFNLGTVLLDTDPEQARERLAAVAGASVDTLVTQRAHYNLGHGFLTASGAGIEADSAVVLLGQAVESNRAAIRLRSGDFDARWNLAVAQRMLDSLGHRPLEPDYQVSAGEDETRVDLNALVRSETGDGASGLEPDTPNPGEVFGERSAPRQGARESWTSQDPGPLEGPAALRFLSDVRDGPEQLIRGLLWSHRPDVAWWNSAPYPGGGW
ncbi:MAG: hypothetical protein WEG36_03405 [Gemmatimonadota bacterium]